MPALTTTPCGRFLTIGDNRPFFLLADTAWELAHRLDLEEIEHYAAIRKSQGFNAVLFCLLAEMDGLRVPNHARLLPLENEDPCQPSEAYFDFVDAILDIFARHGLIAGILPTWGDKWNRVHGCGPEIFHVQNAGAFASWLARRYSGRDLFWVLGGDRKVDSDRHRGILNAMAEGLRGSAPITFHPAGQQDSRTDLRDPDWLDFSMHQSGHCHSCHPNFHLIERDYARTPIRPVLDAEPCYEGHPVMTPRWEPQDERHGDHACRRALYWSVFSGACGHVYGAHPVWQFFAPEHQAEINRARWRWQEALHFPGAHQMGLIHRLLPFSDGNGWFPMQELLLRQPLPECAHLVACRNAGRTQVLVYAPFGDTLALDLHLLSGRTFLAEWIHPATGDLLAQARLDAAQIELACPPGTLDAILTLAAIPD